MFKQYLLSHHLNPFFSCPVFWNNIEQFAPLSMWQIFRYLRQISYLSASFLFSWLNILSTFNHLPKFFFSCRLLSILIAVLRQYSFLNAIQKKRVITERSMLDVLWLKSSLAWTSPFWVFNPEPQIGNGNERNAQLVELHGLNFSFCLFICFY